MGKIISVQSPGSVANVGCGFDMMGFAVDGLGDRLRIQENLHGYIRIKPIQGYGHSIPCDPEKNTAGVAILEMCQKLSIKPGFDLEIEKLSPVGSGLGSSASSTTAAVFALNELLGNPYKDKMALLPFALKGESLASGSYHADNVAPSLLGGFLAIRSLSPIDLVPIPIPSFLKVLLIHPHLEVLTKTARGLVPQMVSMNEVTAQMGNVSAFIMAMVNGDRALLSRSFGDYLAEPYRAPLIPGYFEVKEMALKMGALGCSISGSGPTVFAILDQETDEEEMAHGMQEAFQRKGIGSDCFFSGFNKEGAVLL